VFARRLWPLAAEGTAWPPTGWVTSPGWALSAPGRCGGRPVCWGSRPLADDRGPAAARQRAGDARLRRFCDAQLLITAAGDGRHGRLALRRRRSRPCRHGPVHVAGGAGALARPRSSGVRRARRTDPLPDACSGDRAGQRRPGGRGTRPAGAGGGRSGALPVPSSPISHRGRWPVCSAPGCPPGFRRRVARMPAAWGAFTLYLGVDAALVDGVGLHHQVVADEGTLGEGRSVFVSVSPPWDGSRAPDGQRAVTVSTHTAVEPWWEIYRQRTPAAREVYRRRRRDYADRCLALASRALPGLAAHPEGIRLLLTRHADHLRPFHRSSRRTGRRAPADVPRRGLPGARAAQSVAGGGLHLPRPEQRLDAAGGRSACRGRSPGGALGGGLSPGPRAGTSGSHHAEVPGCRRSGRRPAGAQATAGSG
jgi:hypothetical protein